MCIEQNNKNTETCNSLSLRSRARYVCIYFSFHLYFPVLLQSNICICELKTHVWGYLGSSSLLKL